MMTSLLLRHISHKTLGLLFVLGVAILTITGSVALGSKADAADVRQFNPEYIISDIVFTNHNAMSIGQIQAFLESKNSVCLVNFKTLSLYDNDRNGLGDEPYGNGVNEQVSAATVIWQAAQIYKINPQVILATLQKEQGLITRTDCPSWRYNTALGYGCPDTAPCSESAYGFTRQIDYGVWHFRGFFDDTYPVPPTVVGSKFIQYNPNASCGGSVLNIQNRATASLYSYTPYQPNAATLAAPMGQVVNCGAYGNLNFWRYFTDWFGSTTNPALSFGIIKTADSPALYLQTSAGKYYIPSGEIMAHWGIDTLPIQVVSNAYLNSLPTGSWVGNLLKDEWNNYFIVEGRQIHYVRDLSYLPLYGVSPSDAVQSLGIAYTLPSGNWAGRFLQDASQPTGHYWLVDNGKKHPIGDPSMLYQWRFTPDQLTTVSSAYLSQLPTVPGNITPYASTGGANYVVDTGRKLGFNSEFIKNAYYGDIVPKVYAASTLALLPTETASQFSINSSTGQWFMLEGGKKHYIPNSYLAEIWGKKPTTPLTPLSNNFIAAKVNGGDLTYVVQTANPSAYWLIDGSRRYIADSATAEAWLGENVSPPVYSNESVLALPHNPTNATSRIQAPGSPYEYVLLNGNRHYLSTQYAKDIWSHATTSVSHQLLGSVHEGSFVNYLVQTSSGQAYLLMQGKKYPIDSAFKDAWGIHTSTPTVNTTSLQLYETAATLRSFITVQGRHYIMTPSGIVAVGTHLDAYVPLTNSTQLPIDYFGSAKQASYLIRSTDPLDPSIWLMVGGQKLPLSFIQQVSFGHLSRGVQPTTLTPSTLALIPTSSQQVSNLIQKPGSGIKFLNFGTALGFPDSQTLISYIPAQGILTVAPSIFDSIPLTGNTSRIITDDLGKYYLIHNGTRHWLTNYAAYRPYEHLPRIYLYGTTVATIPEGDHY